MPLQDLMGQKPKLSTNPFSLFSPSDAAKYPWLQPSFNDQGGSLGGLMGPSYYGQGSPFFSNAWNPSIKKPEFNAAKSLAQGGSVAEDVATKAAGALSKINPYMAAASGVLGGIQTIGGLIGLSKLQKEKWPEYEAIPELVAAKSRSARRSKMGFTPEQVASYRANLASILNADYRNAVNMSGGSLAQAITARNQGARIRGLNQLASDDANLLASNIRYDDLMTDKMQRISDMKTQAALQRRIMLEQAYGGAVRSGLGNVGNYFNLQSALQAGNSIA